MFDLIVNGHRNTTRRDLAPLLISWAAHALVIGAVVHFDPVRRCGDLHGARVDEHRVDVNLGELLAASLRER